MFIKKHIIFIIIIILIAILAAAFFIWINRYERIITESHLEKQKEIAAVLDLRLEEIRQQEMKEQKELSDTEYFIRQYLSLKETYNSSKKEIDEKLTENILSISDLILLTEERIDISTSMKEYLTDLPELNNNLNAFISKEKEFLETDMEAYGLIKQYYSSFEASFILNEDMRRKIDIFLAESAQLEAEAFLILYEVVKEYELDYLME